MATVAVTAALLLWGAAVVVVDWRWRRIPNLLLLVLLVPALGLLVWRGQGVLGANALPAKTTLCFGLFAHDDLLDIYTISPYNFRQPLA